MKKIIAPILLLIIAVVSVAFYMPPTTWATLGNTDFVTNNIANDALSNSVFTGNGTTPASTNNFCTKLQAGTYFKLDTVNNPYIGWKGQYDFVVKQDLSPRWQHNATLYPFCWQYVSYCTGTSAYPYDPTASGNPTLTTITGWNNSSNACSANIFSCGTKCGIVGFQVGWTGPLGQGVQLHFLTGQPNIDTTYNNGAGSYGWFVLSTGYVVSLDNRGYIVASGYVNCGSTPSYYVYSATQYTCGSCSATGRTTTVQASSNSLTNGYYYIGTGGYVYKITSSASSGTAANSVSGTGYSSCSGVGCP